MAIRQDRYVAADTNKIKKVDIIEVPQVPDDPVLRRSDVQQQINNSSLPVSSRAVKLAIESINSDLDLKADKTELEGLATEDYVNEKIDEKEIGITEPELISKSVGSSKWMREGAYGLGGLKSLPFTTPSLCQPSGFYYSANTSPVAGSFFIDLKHSDSQAGFRISNAHYSDKFYMTAGDNRGEPLSFRPSCLLLHDRNTFPDTNGYLNTSKNPIATLTTSDMADTVVDNDLLTVTSGAVFRAIKQLTDQIISLETRVRELEDGGV